MDSMGAKKLWNVILFLLASSFVNCINQNKKLEKFVREKDIFWAYLMDVEVFFLSFFALGLTGWIENVSMWYIQKKRKLIPLQYMIYFCIRRKKNPYTYIYICHYHFLTVSLYIFVTKWFMLKWDSKEKLLLWGLEISKETKFKKGNKIKIYMCVGWPWSNFINFTSENNIIKMKKKQK